ncbi:MAG: DUF3365 domain-containing protein [Wenzhouxiangellaceae bacterium]|nr:DUF3365 domain-containing protein [Wenzhouxiangellaceae bacterium]
MKPPASRILPLTLLAAMANASDETSWREQAREAAQQLQSQLAVALVGAINDDGPAHAVQVCKLVAPEIAAEASGPSMTIGRTALRVRNPDNAPDQWETTTLHDFEAQLSNGADPATLETWTIETESGYTIGRWMKAIPTAALCTQCHGSQVDPALLNHIRSIYPQDQAIGFEVGELRGAFTARVILAGPEHQDR